MTSFETGEARTEEPVDLDRASNGGIEGWIYQDMKDHAAPKKALAMDLSLPEKLASFQDTQNEGVSLISSGTLYAEDEPRNIKDEKVSGPPSDHTVAEASVDRLREEGFCQEGELEALGDNEERSSYGIETEDKKREGEKTEAGQQEKCEGNSQTGLKSVQNDKEGDGKESLLDFEGQQKMKERTEKRAKRENKKSGEDVVMGEGDKQEIIKGLDLEDEGKTLKVKREDGIHLRVDGKEEGELKGKGKVLKNVEKGEDCKNDRKEMSDKQSKDNSGQPEGEKKKEKKEKKYKHTSERILTKLEKLDAKIGRILAKKDAYVLRLKEAQERECQESEKAALQSRETSTAVMTKSSTGIGLRREETAVLLDGFRAAHDVITIGASYKQPDIGPSGSRSRTATVIHVSPGHFTEEVAGQKKAGESLPNFLKHERDHSLVTGELESEGNRGVLKHNMQAKDSLGSEAL